MLHCCGYEKYSENNTVNIDNFFLWNYSDYNLIVFLKKIKLGSACAGLALNSWSLISQCRLKIVFPRYMNLSCSADKKECHS